MTAAILNDCRPPLLSIPLLLSGLPFSVEYRLVDKINEGSDLILFGCWSAPKGEKFSLPTTVKDAEDLEILNELISRTQFSGARGKLEIERFSRTLRKGVFGLGNGSQFRRENIFSAGLALGKNIGTSHAKHCTIVCDETMCHADLKVLLWRLGCGLADDAPYKSKKAESSTQLTKIDFICGGVTPSQFSETLDRAIAQIQGGILSMTLCDAPPNYCNCITFAKTIQSCFEGIPNVDITILDEKECESRKMGSFLGVAQGSYHGARLIHVRYKQGEPKKKVAFVGKGITLDTGGMQIKSADNMLQMKCDKGGASAVMGTGLTIAKLQPVDIEIHFIAMVCDNSVSDRAMYPRDILTASNGKTIEVTNTDAEGRLALADGLVYAEEQLGGPGKGTIVDIATLTGAALLGLGAEIGCVYSNNDATRNKIIESAQENGEAAWPLPVWPGYRKALDSKIADFKNSPGKPGYGGSIIAATFLEEFVDPKTSWIHIDAAGPLWNFEEHRATGWGIGMLSDFALKCQ